MGTETTELVVFSKIEATIATLREQNALVKFDYADPKGNKDARSYIFKLRQVKTQVNDIHAAAKADALAFCKRLDVKRNSLLVEVENCIKVHETPIKELERIAAEKEAAAKAKIQAEKEAAEKARLDAIKTQEEELARKQAAFKAEQDKLAAVEAARQAKIIAEEQERQKKIKAENDVRQTEIAKKEAEIKAAQDKLAAVEAAHKAKVTAEETAKKAETERIEREKRIAEEARIKAEQKAKQDLIDAENRRLADIEAEKARAKKEQEAKDLAEFKRKQAEEVKKARLAGIERKRIENEKHRTSVRASILESLRNNINLITENMAREIVTAIDEDKIENVTINY